MVMQDMTNRRTTLLLLAVTLVIASLNGCLLYGAMCLTFSEQAVLIAVLTRPGAGRKPFHANVWESGQSEPLFDGAYPSEVGRDISMSSMSGP
jgi:hypothetical protein